MPSEQGIALTTSSILTFSSNTIVEPEIIPPMLPIKIASAGSTYAQDAVIETNPASGPVIINNGSGFFKNNNPHYT